MALEDSKRRLSFTTQQSVPGKPLNAPKTLGEQVIALNFFLDSAGLQCRCGYARFDKYCCKLSQAIAISSVRSCGFLHQAI